jgi:site-specific recombinase XerD
MLLVSSSTSDWATWDVERKPAIREEMPQLCDDDLLFEDAEGQRPTVAVNRWLRELPVSGAPSPRTWMVYARVLRDWLVHLEGYGTAPFGSKTELRAALAAYSGFRLAGDLDARFDAATWNLHVGVLSRFYKWALEEDLVEATPFTFSSAWRWNEGRLTPITRNNASVRTPKPHSVIKYLERDFADLFVKALGGLRPDGSVDERFRGRELGRNAAVAKAVIASGLRRQEFTYLLTYELPPLPEAPTDVPIQLPVARGLTKGTKQRTTWISYDALAGLYEYVRFERAAALGRRRWIPPAEIGPPMTVEDADWHGAVINGRRQSWASLLPNERLRLVSEDGNCCLLALRSTGEPFLDWPSVFTRTSERIRKTYEPRFPRVSPHRLRHTFAIQTLEYLVDGHYRRAAELASSTATDAALSLYLTKQDPLAVLRDLLGHSSVTTTEIYLRRLDVTRIYQQAYRDAGFGNPEHCADEG